MKPTSERHLYCPFHHLTFEVAPKFSCILNYYKFTNNMLYRLGPGDTSDGGSADGDTSNSLEGTEQSGVDTPINSSLHGSIDYLEDLSELTLSEDMSTSSDSPLEIPEEPEVVSEDSSDEDEDEEIVGFADQLILEKDPLGDGDSGPDSEPEEEPAEQVPGAGEQVSHPIRECWEGEWLT